LPAAYVDLVRDNYMQFFPDDFKVDLNGRTLAWEAVCLIPFCDERLMLAGEEKLLK